MLNRKQVYKICEEDGLAVIQERLRRGTYFGEELKLVERWVARRSTPWLALTLSVFAILVTVLAWWFPRFPPQ